MVCIKLGFINPTVYYGWWKQTNASICSIFNVFDNHSHRFNQIRTNHGHDGSKILQTSEIISIDGGVEYGIGLHGEKCGIGSIMIAKLQGQNWRKIVVQIRIFVQKVKFFVQKLQFWNPVPDAFCTKLLQIRIFVQKL